MASSKPPRPTVLQSAIVTIIGIVIASFGLRDVTTAFSLMADEPPMRSLLVVSAGAAVFVIGAMMLIVAIVRTYFDKKRAIDDAVSGERRS